MTIKTKDGQDYYFTKPNPILLSQNLWPDNEEVTVEGTFGQRFIVDGPVDQPTQVVAESEQEEEPEEIKIINTIAKKQEREMFLPDNGPNFIWCLPVIVNEKIDDLYGETYSRAEFGEKKQIMAKVYDDSNDLYIQYIAKEPLHAGSILYAERRWWKVLQINEMEQKGFFLVSAEISDYQPSFS